VLVGILMLGAVRRIAFDDLTELVPACLAYYLFGLPH
jgi:xanthine/uracil/vitamin C permease (AzgA family)